MCAVRFDVLTRDTVPPSRGSSIHAALRGARVERNKGMKQPTRATRSSSIHAALRPDGTMSRLKTPIPIRTHIFEVNPGFERTLRFARPHPWSHYTYPLSEACPSKIANPLAIVQRRNGAFIARRVEIVAGKISQRRSEMRGSLEQIRRKLRARGLSCVPRWLEEDDETVCEQRIRA
jgi:hypothetical protein